MAIPFFVSDTRIVMRILDSSLTVLRASDLNNGCCCFIYSLDYLDFAVALVLFIVLVHVVYELAIKKREYPISTFSLL